MNRQTDGQTDEQTELADGQTNRWTDVQIAGIQMNRYTDGQAYRWTGIQMDRHTDGQAYRWTGMHTDGQAYKSTNGKQRDIWPDRQIDKQTDTQTDRLT
jgi:hypothetical protein